MSTQTKVAVVFGVGLLCLIFGGLCLYGAAKLREVAEARQKEREEQEQAELQKEREQDRKEAAEALNDPVPPTAEEAATFGRVFDGLGKALQDEDEVTCTEAFDIDRFAKEIDRWAVLEKVPGGNTPANRAAFIQGMRGGIGKALAQNPLLRWERTEIRRVRWTPNKHEAVVIAYHRSAALEDRAIRMRWWLVERQGIWKIYDLEDLDMGMRFSGLIGSIFTSGMIRDVANDLNKLKTAAVGIRESFAALILRNNIDEADQQLEVARGIQLPPPIAAMRELVEGRILLGRGDAEGALKRFEEAARLQPDIPVANPLRAAALSAAGRPDEALPFVRKYLAELGPDADAYAVEGVALKGLNRPAEAAESFRKALNDLPGMPEALDGLRQVLPDANKSELGGHVAKAPDPLKAFNELLREAQADNDKAAVSSLNEWLRKSHPDDPRVIRAMFDELVEAKKFEEAAAALRERLEKPGTDDVKQRVLNYYLYAMIGANKPLEAYAAAPDDRTAAAFRLLAEEFDDQLDDAPANAAEPIEKSLRELIAAHRKRTPDDAWLLFYEGSLLKRARKYAEAEQMFAEGQTKLPKRVMPDPEKKDWDANRFRAARVECFYALKEGLKAYAELGPSDETFHQLAYCYDNDKDADGLEALIAAHRKNAPSDMDLKYWTAEVFYLRENYAEAATRFRTFIKGAGENEQNRWQATDKCIRGFLRANRTADARDMIAEVGPERVSAGLRVAVALAARLPARAEEILAEHAAKPGGCGFMYYDEDFARIIQRPENANLRKKYPDTRPMKPAGPTG